METGLRPGWVIVYYKCREESSSYGDQRNELPTPMTSQRTGDGWQSQSSDCVGIVVDLWNFVEL